MTDTERKTWAVQPGHFVFEHQTMVAIGPMGMEKETDPVPRAMVALCVTRAPACRCECGQFNIAWYLSLADRARLWARELDAAPRQGEPVLDEGRLVVITDKVVRQLAELLRALADGPR